MRIDILVSFQMMNITPTDLNAMSNLMTLSNLTTTSPLNPEPVISDKLREYLDAVMFSLTFSFAVLGVVTNTVNIRVFVAQGLISDSCTIGLFTLAVTDFLGCLFEIPPPLCMFTRYLGTMPAYFTCAAWTSLIGHTTHMMMSRITCWITVYIAIQRSLCVLIPFKVKHLLKPKLTTISLALIYFVIICAYFPFYLYTWVGTTFHPQLNSTITVLVQNARGKLAAYYISVIFNVILSSAAIVIVAIATGLMIYKLVKFKKTLRSLLEGTDEPETEQTSQYKRDVEVLRTVTMVTGLFLICMLMSHIIGVAFAVVPDATPSGLNKNFFYVAYGYKVLFDLINSSLNYFFYIRVASRYKAAYRKVFRKNETKKRNQKHHGLDLDDFNPHNEK